MKHAPWTRARATTSTSSTSGEQTEAGETDDSFAWDPVDAAASVVTGARTVTTGYTIDAMGRVTSQAGGGSTTTFTLNNKSQVTQQTTVSGGVTATTTNSFTDASGLYYLGQIVSQTTTQGSNSQTLANSFAWYGGPERSQTVVTGTGQQSPGTTNYTLDAFGQVMGASTTGGTTDTLAYVYDAAGQGIAKIETLNGISANDNWYRMGGVQMWHYSSRFDPRRGDVSGAYTVHAGETMETAMLY